ncbi:MAG: radical SAM protein [Candidatus Omnitrophica bacterium]|nr:radical SAM protein [Candidatus Omnitrophota bacterium]
MKEHYTIPFFIPHEGCPHTCIFCAQKKISGRKRAVSVSEISSTIRKYLKTIPDTGTKREAAFFGGSFTALPIEKQEAYLMAVRPFIRSHRIHGIRISTRPDCINEDILKMLKRCHVNCIELGVQSMSARVLDAAKRGHTPANVRKASRFIRMEKFTLGHQIMVGLPGSTPAGELATARMSIAMKASEVRIYPVIVMRGTALAVMWKSGRYSPLTEDEAVARCASLVRIFRKSGVKVLRCGLHPSEGLIGGRDMLAGPFHQSFGQKVASRIYGDMIRKLLKKEASRGPIRHIFYNPAEGASVMGYRRENAVIAESALGRRNIFRPHGDVPRGSIEAGYDNNIFPFPP